jgi:23S rRNA pseudouridine955/2504/2580 synthase
VSKVFVVEVAEAQEGQRIDNFLLTYLKGVPKSRVYKAIRKGEVRVNGGRVKQTYRLTQGERLRIPPIQLADKKAVMPPSERWVTCMNAQIIIQRPDVMIINKPAGMPVHAGTGIERGLIENIKASDYFGQEWELVHRLDRDTSGLLVLAKEGMALKKLHEAFRERQVQKGYFLWVKGAWKGGERLVEYPLSRREGRNGERMVVVDDKGQPARTCFVPQQVLTDRSLLWALPETGRTHQIRVHAAALGHPVLGDKKYGNCAVNQHIQEHFPDRLFLHAAMLCFKNELSHFNVCALPDFLWNKMSGWPNIAVPSA